MKRAFDIVVSAWALLLLLPLIVITAIAIKSDSRGPVFYRQVRVGRLSRPFVLYKFRSMRVGADAQGLLSVSSGATEDPRTTRVGVLLRRTKWDEVPQLLNVLKGDMSIVGPRPEVPLYVTQYTQEQKLVLSVRPGLTDPASIYYRNESEVLANGAQQNGCSADQYYTTVILPHKLALSLAYIRTRSFGSDIKIIFQTIGSLFCCK